jgi:predicted TIM-barrel fold metal-dependent hydrolase
VLREEIAHLERKPSEYVRDHFWFSTQPGVETELPEQFYELYAQWERAGLAGRLMFSSDYPHWDMDSPFEAVPRGLSREVKERILYSNAAEFYDFVPLHDVVT